MEDLSENINEKINSIGNITENISIKFPKYIMIK